MALTVARWNRDLTVDAQLQEFLFGADRVLLAPVREDLRELQSNRCFYCDGRLPAAVQVDHFVPWARIPDNGIENLVVADTSCNHNKRDFLAAGAHVERWCERIAVYAADLDEIARRATWDRHPARTLGAARAIYSRLPHDVSLWLEKKRMVPMGLDHSKIIRALAG